MSCFSKKRKNGKVPRSNGSQPRTKFPFYFGGKITCFKLLLNRNINKWFIVLFLTPSGTGIILITTQPTFLNTVFCFIVLVIFACYICQDITPFRREIGPCTHTHTHTHKFCSFFIKDFKILEEPSHTTIWVCLLKDVLTPVGCFYWKKHVTLICYPKLKSWTSSVNTR